LTPECSNHFHCLRKRCTTPGASRSLLWFAPWACSFMVHCTS